MPPSPPQNPPKPPKASFSPPTHSPSLAAPTRRARLSLPLPHARAGTTAGPGRPSPSGRPHAGPAVGTSMRFCGTCAHVFFGACAHVFFGRLRLRPYGGCGPGQQPRPASLFGPSFLDKWVGQGPSFFGHPSTCRTSPLFSHVPDGYRKAAVAPRHCAPHRRTGLPWLPCAALGRSERTRPPSSARTARVRAAPPALASVAERASAAHRCVEAFASWPPAQMDRAFRAFRAFGGDVRDRAGAAGPACAWPGLILPPFTTDDTPPPLPSPSHPSADSGLLVREAGATALGRGPCVAGTHCQSWPAMHGAAQVRLYRQFSPPPPRCPHARRPRPWPSQAQQRPLQQRQASNPRWAPNGSPSAHSCCSCWRRPAWLSPRARSQGRGSRRRPPPPRVGPWSASGLLDAAARLFDAVDHGF